MNLLANTLTIKSVSLYRCKLGDMIRTQPHALHSSSPNLIIIGQKNNNNNFLKAIACSKSGSMCSSEVSLSQFDMCSLDFSLSQWVHDSIMSWPHLNEIKLISCWYLSELTGEVKHGCGRHSADSAIHQLDVSRNKPMWSHLCLACVNYQRGTAMG